MRTREEIIKSAEWVTGEAWHMSQAPNANTPVLEAILEAQLDIRDILLEMQWYSRKKT